jgi:endonuclease V-like protein UPF0215 family
VVALSLKRFRVIKHEIRVLGVDDGVFKPHTKGFASVVGVVFRGGYWLDGVMHTRVRIDGLDATEKIASMVLGSPHRKQLRVIMLNGVTVAGFNVVDIKKLSAETKLPVIAITREEPDFDDIHKALKNLTKCEERWRIISGMREVHELSTGKRGERIYMQVTGICVQDAEKIVRLTSTRSNIPEALRVAHLVASGMTCG